MTMHTEGPWSAAETRHNCDTVIRGPKGDPIALALIAGYTKQEGAANTVLLAAAPDLLEACRAAWWNSLDLPESVREVLSAAIARATGEQP